MIGDPHAHVFSPLRMIRCSSCLRPWGGPRPANELAKAVRQTIAMGGLHSQIWLLVAELEGVCPNCRFEWAAEQISEAIQAEVDGGPP